MDTLNSLQSPLQKHWTKFLCLLAYVLAVYHLLFAAFRYVISSSPFSPFSEGEFWFAVCLLAITVLSFLIFLIFFPQVRSAIKNFLHRMLSYEQIFAAVFFIWYIIVCCIRQAVEGLPYLPFLKNEIAFTAVSGLILFPLASSVGKQRSFPLIDFLLHLVVLSYTVFTVIVLYNAFHLQNLILPSGNVAGLTAQMMLSLGTYYNMTGAIACMMVCLSFYMIFSQKLCLKILYSIIALIHLLVVILSNSRTDFLGSLFVIAAAAFCYSWYFCEKKKTHIFLRVSLSFLFSFLLGFLFWQLRPAIISMFDSYTGFSAASQAALYKNAIFPMQLSSRFFSWDTVPLAASAREVTVDLNGRVDIWRAALKVIFHSPLNFFFGVTPGGITDALCRIGGLTEQFYGTHNAFLDVAAEFGVPAFFAFVIFTIKIIIRCFRILFQTKKEDFKKVFMIPLTIFTLYVLNLTEGYLIAYFCVQSYLFYLFCGWVVALDT